MSYLTWAQNKKQRKNNIRWLRLGTTQVCKHLWLCTTSTAPAVLHLFNTTIPFVVTFISSIFMYSFVFFLARLLPRSRRLSRCVMLTQITGNNLSLTANSAAPAVTDVFNAVNILGILPVGLVWRLLTQTFAFTYKHNIVVVASFFVFLVLLR